MSRIIWVPVLLVIFIGSLLANAPARLLAGFLPQDVVIMQGFSGTLWKGRAGRTMVSVPAGFLHLGTVQWSLRPWSLLTLSPQVNLRSDWGSQVINADLIIKGTQDLVVRELDARVDADLLRQFAPVALSGSFSTQLQEFELKDGLPYSAKGRVVWENAAWVSPGGSVPLGSYALDVEQAPGEVLMGEVVTLSGPLQAEGELQLEGRRYAVDILTSGDDALAGPLKNALSMLAEPGPDGYRIVLDGEF
ncbi:MAG: general secretion pathway protein N [Bacteroidia bacterium]|jgi:general secretion pathway protein N